MVLPLLLAVLNFLFELCKKWSQQPGDMVLGEYIVKP